MNTKSYLASFATLAGVMSTLHAAPITWGSPTSVGTAAGNSSDVSTNGTPVEAYNAVPNDDIGTATPITVNGVTFTPTTGLLGADPRNGGTNDFSSDTNSGDTEYDDLLSRLEYGGGTNLVTITVGDGDGDASVTGAGLLVPGEDYEIQVWYVDDRSGQDARVTPVGDGNGNTVDLNDQFSIGTFTADATTQDITLASPGFGQAHVNAYQIRSLASGPPPVTVTLSSSAVEPVTGPYTVDLVFSEDVTGLQDSDFTVVNGTASGVSPASGPADTYTVTITPDGAGNISVTLPAASVLDDDGDNTPNNVSNTLVTIYDNGSSIFVTPLLDLSGRDVLGLGGGESNGYFTSPKPFGPTTDFSLNDVAYSHGGLTGTFDVTFSATSTMNGIKRGGKGGWGTADSSGGSALVDVGASITIDSLALSDLQGDLAGAPIFNIEIIAVYLGNASTGDGATINGAVATGAGGGDTIEAMRNDITPASSVVILGTGTGNGYSINGIAIQFEVGTPVAPSPNLSTVATSPVSAPFTVDVTFTEDVTGLEESDFQVTNGTVTAASLSGSGDTYSVEITPTANGDVEVTLPAGSVDDLDGDNAQNTVSNTLSLFHLAPGSDFPGVTLSTASPTVSAAYTVDVTFDEAVTGLTDSDFDVTNGTASGLAGSGAIYSILITPAGEGDVTVLLPADRVTDTDGDNLQNTASNSLVTAYSLPDVPTVQLYGILTSARPSFDIYLSFSEEITGLTDSDFRVVNGSASGTISTSADTLDSHLNPLQGRFYKTTITAASPGPVEITLPAGVVTDTDGDNDTNLASNTYTTQCTSDFGDKWIIDDQASWTAVTGTTSNMTITDGMVEPTANTAQFSSNAINFPVKRQATFLTLEQSPVWDNWTNAGNVQPSGAGDAPILVSVSNDNYYFLGNSGGVYHAWHSTDMVNWTHKGPVTSGGGGRWTTSAEFKDGEFYIYSDDPNDHNPRLFKDADLDDGVPGTDMGLAFVKEASGSDTAVIRSDETGLFHLISEDWTPLNASTHAWDSPLASHTSSADGLNGFTAHEHHPPIDLRTTSTGTFSTYNHPNKSNVLYEVHSPEQNAFGDWTAIKIGSRYYMFSDYDPAGQSIRLAKFTSDSIYEEFDFLGQVETHSGHPDPTCGFAEGQFYLITQQSTDWISPGPWVAGVEARAGVDTDGDTVIDQWTTWQTVTESYDHKAGYIRVVEKTPAQLDLTSLPPGYNFEFEFRIDDTVVPDTSPIMDRAELCFEPDHFQQWANAEGTPAVANADHNANTIPNLVEFALGQSTLPQRLPNGAMTVTTKKDALDDGYSVDLEFSDTLLPGSWETATMVTVGVKLLSATTLPNGDEEATYELIAPNGTHVFWRIAVQ